MEHCRILIVGGGLAGLALARALRQAGFAPELIEREAAWDVAGTGMYLPANGVRALRALALDQAVAARAAEIPHQRLLDRRGRRLATIDLRQLWGALGPCLALPRAELHKVLRDGVLVRLGRSVRSLDHLDGPVGVTFDDGNGGEFDLVVGADGLRSTVRRLAVDQRPPIPVGQHSWRFLATCPPQSTTWTVMFGRGSSFLTVPVGGGLVYCYADVTTDAADEPNGDPVGRLRECFAGFAAPVPALLEQLDDLARVHVAPIEQVAEECWGRGAVVLVGRAGRRCRPRHVAQHGRGRLPSVRGRPRAGRAAARRRHRRGGAGRLCGSAKTPYRLGPRSDPPPGPDQEPPAGTAGPHPARLRPTDLPVQLPAAAAAHLDRNEDESAADAARFAMGPLRAGRSVDGGYVASRSPAASRAHA
jgi:FAD-dependent urate hydroxylase